MRRETSSSSNRLFRKMLRSSLLLAKAISKIISQALKFIVRQIFWETLFWVATLGLVYLLVNWGISQHIALYLAIAIILMMLVFAAYIVHKSSPKKKETKGEVKLAHWIAQTFAHKSSTEWTEYQDWLHDILLSRRQLLDAKYPRWKVKLITYWRLSNFCLVVGINKIKQAAVSIKKSR